MHTELSIKLRFKADSATGLLLLAGDPGLGQFVAVELRNQYLVYSFNLGSATASLQSDAPYPLYEWHNVEVRRNGRSGSMSVNNEPAIDLEYTGTEETLSITTDIFLGGYAGQETPFYDVQAVNFTGCVEDVFIGPDSADLNSFTEAVNTRQGCEVEVRNQAKVC